MGLLFVAFHMYIYSKPVEYPCLDEVKCCSKENVILLWWLVYMLQNAVQLVEMFKVCYILSATIVHDVHM
jgi:hypothetical protein